VVREFVKSKKYDTAVYEGKLSSHRARGCRKVVNYDKKKGGGSFFLVPARRDRSGDPREL